MHAGMVVWPYRVLYDVAGHHYSTDMHARGSKFLKAWMGFLEENADLRYPNLADVYGEE
jgi:hypothetical protein